jgi:hypothetical protein
MVGEPAEPGSVGSAHQSKAEKAVSIRLAEARLKRLEAQNQKLALEMRAKQGNLVELDVIKRQVLAANHTVKNQLLALPNRLAGDLSVTTDPRAIREMLRRSIIETLNELAYEHGVERPRL